MNSFLNSLSETNNMKKTENGAVAYKSTRNAVYDLFSLGGAYRQRSDEDCMFLFKKAYDENPDLAMKCLFYLRDIRGGQGERRFFRQCFHWLAKNHPVSAKRNIVNVAEYGRYDDILYALDDTALERTGFNFFDKQLKLDMESKTPSLCAKWAPSINASSAKTKSKARQLAKYMGMTHKQYRQMLAGLRTRINVLEKLMSENRWDEIEFDKIPSQAGLKYRNAFARRDIIKKKYESFIKSIDTKVNASTLYPYEVVNKVTSKGFSSRWGVGGYGRATYTSRLTGVEREAVNKYWANLKDYFNGQSASMMCVCDTSGSMTWGGSGTRPIDVAISLSMYCAERLGGPFHGHYISFASKPQLISVDGIDFCDKVARIYGTNLCDNTNLEAVFDLVLKTALQPGVKRSDIPKTLVVISDMEIDAGCANFRTDWTNGFFNRTTSANALMENVRKRYAAYGIEVPQLVYWNVNARNDTILDLTPGVSLVSGCSPVIFEQVMTGKTGWDLCLDKLNSARYEAIRA